jgi:hypothetical protein
MNFSFLDMNLNKIVMDETIISTAQIPKWIVVDSLLIKVFPVFYLYK